MTDFATAPATVTRLAPLDPSKHVRYTLGMVLGVEDFDQEFAYLSGRDRWLARDLSGYGVVWGLGVAVEVSADQGPRIAVAPGVAVTPCGRLVCVTPAQCAAINDWLTAHEDEVRARMQSPPGPLELHLVLAYRECPTDDLPIPGEPCRDESTLSAPSRVKDDFRLELRFEPPAQREEDAIRDLVAWLRKIPVVAGPGSTETRLLEALGDAAAQAVAELESPPSSPPDSPPEVPFDFVLGDPPADLAFGTDTLPDRLRSAFAHWVAALRPALRHALPGCDCGCGAAATPVDEDVVLLADITLDLAPGPDLEVADDGWSVATGRRPYLLHTRLLQEWMLSGPALLADGSPPSGPAPVDPIAGVAAHEVAGAPEALWDAPTRTLDLGIPRGQGIDAVNLTVLPEGANPAVMSFTGGVLTLGIGPGRKGDPGESGETVKRPLDVAAGQHLADGSEEWAFGGLEVKVLDQSRGLYFLTFDGFEADRRYVVKGTPLTHHAEQAHTYEVIHRDDIPKLLADVGDVVDPDTGFFIRVSGARSEDPARGFMTEVTDYTELG